MTTPNTFIAISDALSRTTLCTEPCTHGGACTRPRGHDGNHQAEGTREVLCEWTQGGIEVDPPNARIEEQQ